MVSRRHSTSVIAAATLIAATTFGAASAATAADVLTYPAEVFPGITVESPHPDYVIDIACTDLDVVFADRPLELVWVPGGSLDISFDCDVDQVDGISADLDIDATFLPGYESLLDGVGGSDRFLVDPNTRMTFLLGAQTLIVDYLAGQEIADPQGSLLFTESAVFPAGGGSTAIFDTSTGDDCDVEGRHIYQTIDFTVLDDGVTTFRVAGISPLQGGEFYRDEWTFYTGNPWGDVVPVIDPYLVLYSSFDPANPDANQIACNDDSDAASFFDRYEAYDSSGTFISGLFSELIVDLVPGQYTLLVTTYDDADLDVASAPVKDGALGAALAPVAFALSDLPEQSVTMQIWGTENALVLGHVAFLAETGADARVAGLLAGAAALSLVVGTTLVVVRRRRSPSRA